MGEFKRKLFIKGDASTARDSRLLLESLYYDFMKKELQLPVAGALMGDLQEIGVDRGITPEPYHSQLAYEA